jgi:hypothetical protein
MSCPVNDDKRAALVREAMDAYRPLVRQGKVTGVLYFSWDSEPAARTIYRCGQLTKAGIIAMQPLDQ